MSKLRVSLAITINLGNYNNCRVAVELEEEDGIINALDSNFQYWSAKLYQIAEDELVANCDKLMQRIEREGLIA